MLLLLHLNMDQEEQVLQKLMDLDSHDDLKEFDEDSLRYYRVSHKE